jgi:hypothetical protein
VFLSAASGTSRTKLVLALGHFKATHSLDGHQAVRVDGYGVDGQSYGSCSLDRLRAIVRCLRRWQVER